MSELDKKFVKAACGLLVVGCLGVVFSVVRGRRHGR